MGSRSIVFLGVFVVIVVGGCSIPSRGSGAAAGGEILPGRVVFHETWVIDRWQDHGFDRAWEDYRGHKPERPPRFSEEVTLPRFEDPRGVLELVLSQAPRYTNVFPTERYYYYRAGLADGEVWGNLRFTDVEDGVLHIGYFDPLDRSQSRAASFSEEDGVFVIADGRRVAVRTNRGRTTEFLLCELDATDDNLKLLLGEVVVAGVLDESGIPLTLLYNEEEGCFYYILREHLPIADTILPTDISRVFIGWNSGFAFFRDGLGRLVLFGVRAGHIQQNSYYDGPFDQVPPHLPLRDKLEAAYPYVTYRGGIDEHGRFRNLPGMRVAISPYRTYQSRAVFLEWAQSTIVDSEGLPSSARLARLTYESKRDFHKKIVGRMGNSEIFPRDHFQWQSQAWPANHHGTVSLLWPQDHLQLRSQQWPKNHLPAQSRSD